MTEYRLQWKIDYKMAFKLCYRQFLHHWFKYVLMLSLILTLFIVLPGPPLFLFCGPIVLCFYVLSFSYLAIKRMCPQKNYEANYKGLFGKDNCEIIGNAYKRNFGYSQIDRVILDCNNIILLTKNEGIIIPSSIFVNEEEKKLFIRDIILRIP